MSAPPPRATVREVTPPRRTTPSSPSPARGAATARSAGRPGRHPGASRGSVFVQERASFGYAFQGLSYAWSTQRHLRVHVSLALLACGMGLFFTISAAEWAALLAVIALVITAELLNTVVEILVDLVTSSYHPNAKAAKDVAAAAVLVAAAGALAVGAVIFIPRLVGGVIR